MSKYFTYHHHVRHIIMTAITTCAAELCLLTYILIYVLVDITYKLRIGIMFAVVDF